MWCLRARKLLSAFVDGELAPGQGASLASHVDGCRWCRRDLRRIERGAELARGVRAVEIPPASRSMLPRIAAVGRQSTKPLASHTRWLAPAAATLLFALLLGLSRFDSRLPQKLWPFGRAGTVYALDFGLDAPRGDESLLEEFRARYAGKFREFEHAGPLDPAWVPYAVKYPMHLPPRMRLRSVMIFDPNYCGSLVLNFSDGTRNVHFLQQPADRPISLSGLKTTTADVCKYNATHGEIGAYSLVTWTADEIRSVLLCNLDRGEIEGIVESLR